MASVTPSGPLTQIIYLNIPPALDLKSRDSEAGRTWAAVLDLIETTPGYIRVYWGRRWEEAEKVQLHVVRETHSQHKEFLRSSLYQEQFLPLVKKLAIPGSVASGIPEIQVRHAYLTHQALENPVGKNLIGYPIGTAIYKGCEDSWYEGAWPLWTHVVRYVSGCKGIVGGKVVEPVDDLVNSYLVYVGWQTVRHHDDYHHTNHFRKRFIILNIGHKGYTEYGHVIFQEVREKQLSKI